MMFIPEQSLTLADGAADANSEQIHKFTNIAHQPSSFSYLVMQSQFKDIDLQ